VRAVRNTEAGVAVVAVPEPAPEGEQVVVHVRSAGICGSDLHMLAWGALPHTLGHEIGGHLDDGTPVAISPLAPCGTCDRCGAGEPQQCRTAAARLLGVGADGGMADVLAVDPSRVVALPDGVSAADGCLAEPLACSLHALRRAGLGSPEARAAPGTRVAVVGAGSIGLGAAAAARWLGFLVDVAARHPAQRDAAVAIGAGGEPEGEYEVVVDAAGTSASLARCFGLLRPGGTVVIVASAWEPLKLPAFFTTKEPTIVTASMHDPGSGEPGTGDLAAAARLLADLPEVAAALVTHRFPLERAADAFATAADRAAGAIKVVLEP
jgi:threonine dehydrogenase-like Zn-dependent dehydrogenase